jgi:O-antigen ligase
MSRFNNPKALPGLLSQRPRAATGMLPSAPNIVVNERVRPAAPLPGAASTLPYEDVPNKGQVFCFYVLTIYLLSGCANDLIFRFTQGNAYITATCILLLPLFYIATGAPLRALQMPTGRWYTAFTLWVVIAVPFSIWRGGSVGVLVNYIPRDYLVCLYLAACAVSLRQVRTLVQVMRIGAVFVLMSCYAFGGSVYGRFAIPGSLFYGNANELGLQLLLGIIILGYSFFGSNKLVKVLSALAIFVSLIFILKTGSRGVFLATLATGFVVFLLSRQRILMLIAAVPAIIIAFLLAPTDMQQRLATFGSSQEDASSNGVTESAVGSTTQRQQLLKTSLYLTVTNPVFGVGPGQFAVKVAGDDEKKGLNSAWLGTHNSYTQVSSECGLPALVFYVATIVTCILMNYRLYRRSNGRPGLETIAGMSFCMFLSMFAYSISIFTFHEAYSLHLPLLAGVSICLYLAASPILERYENPVA